MEKRASIPVSLPRDNPTVSYWQDPPDEIADLRSTGQLPETADVVIVGSGISGAAITHNILLRAPETKIVLLEARQACSGATGRNGNRFPFPFPFFFSFLLRFPERSISLTSPPRRTMLELRIDG